MNREKEHLYKTVHRWEQGGHLDRREAYPFMHTLNEILFHAGVRFEDYEQFKDEGPFPLRLKNWLENLASDRERKVLFKLLPSLIFIDRHQMKAFYRDAYRRLIIPWACQAELTASDMVSPDYDAQVRNRVSAYPFLSITESFSFPLFSNINNLAGLDKPIVIGENPKALSIHSDKLKHHKGAIVLEDFVGTGKQARDVLQELRKQIPTKSRLLFVPLIALDIGITAIRSLAGVETSPVLIIPSRACLKKSAGPNESPTFKELRPLVRSTAERVLAQNGDLDDPPSDAFGYKGCGALVVTAHNTPNNSLPLIHHRAPMWSPLFRRLHHKGQGSKDFLR
jgi:hypothetical protein